MTSFINHLYGSTLCVAEFSENNQMVIHEEKLKEIFQQDNVKNRNIVAFSTIGAFRKGKSFFLDYCLRFLYANYESTKNSNKRLDCDNWMGSSDTPLSGFSWRSGSTRDTSGILMWNDVFLHTVPLTGEQLAIVVIDTQGLFDSETTPVDNSRIFALGTLISSILVLNLNGTVQEDQLQYLQFATEFASFATQDAEDDFDKPFQNMMLLIRDWVNSDEHAYGLIGGESYLKKLLEIKAYQNETLKSVRKSIRNSFESINCTLLPHPGKKVTGAKGIYDGNWGEMEEDFQFELKTVIEHILSPKNLVIKQINGRKQNGSNYMEFIKKYFELFQTDELPKAQSIYDATVEKQLDIINEKCLNVYKEFVFPNLTKITSLESIQIIHQTAKDFALRTYASEKKMGNKVHQEASEVKLTNKIDQFYTQWSSLTEESFLKIRDALEKAEQIMEEKRLEYEQHVEALNEATEQTMKLEEEKSSMHVVRYEEQINQVQERVESEIKHLKEIEIAIENERKYQDLLDAQLSSLQPDVQEATEISISAKTKFGEIGFSFKSIREIFRNFYNNYKSWRRHSHDHQKQSKYKGRMQTRDDFDRQSDQNPGSSFTNNHNY